MGDLLPVTGRHTLDSVAMAREHWMTTKMNGEP
jgi:hypothetical protein